MELVTRTGNILPSNHENYHRPANHLINDTFDIHIHAMLSLTFLYK